MTRRRGTVALVCLPPGDFPVSIFDMVLNRITVRRLDRRHPAGPGGGAAVRRRGQGRLAPTAGTILDNVNAIFDRMREGAIEGRVVMRI